MEGLLLWLSLGLLFVSLTTGTRNEWQGIRYLMARLKGGESDFSRPAHRSLGKVSIFFGCLWGLIFIASAPTMFRQFTPGVNILLILGVMCMSLVTLLSGWLVMRRERKPLLLLHQMLGYIFIVAIAGMLMLLVEENFFDSVPVESAPAVETPSAVEPPSAPVEVQPSAMGTPPQTSLLGALSQTPTGA